MAVRPLGAPFSGLRAGFLAIFPGPSDAQKVLPHPTVGAPSASNSWLDKGYRSPSGRFTLVHGGPERMYGDFDTSPKSNGVNLCYPKIHFFGRSNFYFFKTSVRLIIDALQL